MCGICGIVNFARDSLVDEAVLNGMNAALDHRGPDGSGFFINRFVGLGHRRLSIIDLKNGTQPMSNENQSVWVTYNGEIYNFAVLKDELAAKGHVFRTHCDTEVIVHGYEEYGIECVHKLNGMFAFAVWDEKNQTLFLARDRMGIKPIYYCVTDRSIVFASEIKSILRHPAVRAELDIESVPQYLFCTAMLDGKTMFRNIKSLPAGHLATVRESLSVRPYWDLIVDTNEEHPYEYYRDHTLKLLSESVQMQLMSDVPFGSLLSGGLDSSMVSALATRHLPEVLKTFSMDYGKNGEIAKPNSDTQYARIMSRACKTDHREYIFDPGEYGVALEKVTWHMEKPVELTTPSLHLLYRSLKDDVTVVLSGEGADEMFGGYFFFLQSCEQEPREFPWAPYFNEVSMILNPDVERETGFRDEMKSALGDLTGRFPCDDAVNRVLYMFLKVYLLEMLERQDKMSMAWGVESRVPFLDHRLVQWAVNIPSKYKIADGIEKFILKDIGRELLPEGVVERRKKPFPFPVDPKSVFAQKNVADNLVRSGRSKISSYFDKKKASDFLNRRNEFEKIDSLAVFRTSYAMIALELWFKTFGV